MVTDFPARARKIAALRPAIPPPIITMSSLLILSFPISSLIRSSLVGVKGNSAEEVVDEILDRYLMNLQQHPEFYAFLFEMWCASRRSKKIKSELENCIEKVVIAIEKLLDDVGNNSMLKSSRDESREIAKALLALSDGIAFHLLINHPENLKNKKFWSLIKSMMLAVLKEMA